MDFSSCAIRSKLCDYVGLLVAKRRDNMATEKKTTTAQGSLRITLKRSPIGTPQKHRLVLRGLGLRKLNATVLRPASDQVKGMIAKVGYLLEVSPQ